MFFLYKFFIITDTEYTDINTQLEENTKRLIIMQSLTDKAIAISKGDFTQRVSTDLEANEFNELAKAFNTMAVSIQRLDMMKMEFIAKAATN
jgi:HAMP domain.